MCQTLRSNFFSCFQSGEGDKQDKCHGMVVSATMYHHNTSSLMLRQLRIEVIGLHSAGKEDFLKAGVMWSMQTYYEKKWREHFISGNIILELLEQRVLRGMRRVPTSIQGQRLRWGVLWKSRVITAAWWCKSHLNSQSFFSSLQIS
jgi:hypothetical protein